MCAHTCRAHDADVHLGQGSKPSLAITARSSRDFRYLKMEVRRYISRICIPPSRKVRMSATTICCGGSFQKARVYLTMAQARSASSPIASMVCRERSLATKHLRSCSTVSSTAFTPLDHTLAPRGVGYLHSGLRPSFRKPTLFYFCNLILQFT